MNSFKTLIRKSDGQWMKINMNHTITETKYPELTSMSKSMINEFMDEYFEFGFDWSLYDLIEVAIIRLDDVPSDIAAEVEMRQTLMPSAYPKNTGAALKKGWRLCYEWYKSQIFKP